MRPEFVRPTRDSGIQKSKGAYRGTMRAVRAAKRTEAEIRNQGPLERLVREIFTDQDNQAESGL
jgi:hypothetical protein